MASYLQNFYYKLVIEEGGLFDGTCKMDKGAEAAAKKVTPIREKEAKGEKIVDL